MRIIVLFAAALFCASCGPRLDNVKFVAGANQQSMVRDGHAALVSKQKKTIVLLRPASRQILRNGRPVFVVGVNNLSGHPLDFLIHNIRVSQTVNGESAPIKVITYEELVQEEHTRQTIQAIAVGLSAGANAISAANAGRYHSTTTVNTPRGVYTAHTVAYSPTAAAIAQSNAAAQNDAMISATIEQGRQNLTMLERGVAKDNTLMPGEWYGGQVHLAPPVGQEGPRTYTIALSIAGEQHRMEVVQEAAN